MDVAKNTNNYKKLTQSFPYHNRYQSTRYFVDCPLRLVPFQPQHYREFQPFPYLLEKTPRVKSGRYTCRAFLSVPILHRHAKYGKRQREAEAVRLCPRKPETHNIHRHLPGQDHLALDWINQQILGRKQR